MALRSGIVPCALIVLGAVISLVSGETANLYAGCRTTKSSPAPPDAFCNVPGTVPPSASAFAGDAGYITDSDHCGDACLTANKHCEFFSFLPNTTSLDGANPEYGTCSTCMSSDAIFAIVAVDCVH